MTSDSHRGRLASQKRSDTEYYWGYACGVVASIGLDLSVQNLSHHPSTMRLTIDSVRYTTLKRDNGCCWGIMP